MNPTEFSAVRSLLLASLEKQDFIVLDQSLLEVLQLWEENKAQLTPIFYLDTAPKDNGYLVLWKRKAWQFTEEKRAEDIRRREEYGAILEQRRAVLLQIREALAKETAMDVDNPFIIAMAEKILSEESFKQYEVAFGVVITPPPKLPAIHFVLDERNKIQYKL